MDTFEFNNENARLGINDFSPSKTLHIGGQKQTAVDLYIDEINKSCRESGIHVQLQKEGAEYNQAKAMEKEQIVIARWFGDYSCDLIKAEQYYNETYGK
jgi:hypothetical protein